MYYLSDEEVIEFNKRNLSKLYSLQDSAVLESFKEPDGISEKCSNEQKELFKTPEILNRIESILGTDLVLFRYLNKAKRKGQLDILGWHSDGFIWNNSQHPSLKKNSEVVTVWIAISDVTIRNGCMYYVPEYSIQADASNRDFDGVIPGEYTPQPLEMKRGDFVMFNEKMTHYSPPSKDAEPRLSIIIRATKRSNVIDDSAYHYLK